MWAGDSPNAGNVWCSQVELEVSNVNQATRHLARDNVIIQKSQVKG